MKRGKIVQPYEHDCDRCQWINWVTVGETLGNMYICNTGDGRLTEIIIRWSDKPEDYSCYSVFKDCETKPTPIEIFGGDDAK
jgi:hypothetical protein